MKWLITTIALISCSTGMASSLWDNELRCCLTINDRKNVFIVNLTTPELTKAELRITDPTGTTSGYEPKRNQYTKPTPALIYASFLDTYTPFEHHHPQGRNKGIVINKLIHGNYNLDVIGVKDGRYALSFSPAGYGASRGSVHIGGNHYINIKQGEVHTYQFPGKFDNVLDGSIPISSPTRFKVKRIK